MRIFLYFTSSLIVILLTFASCSSPETSPSNLTNKQVEAPIEASSDKDSTASGKELDAPLGQKPTKKEPESGTAIADLDNTKEQGLTKKISRKTSENKTEKRKKRPAIEFEQSTFNYGKIQQGDKVEHQFYFTNTGKVPLTITNVKASCGCTQPSFPFIPIEPGEKGYIGVVFDSKGKLGKQKPVITVNTNANPPTYKLYLEGFVDAGPLSDVSISNEKPSKEQ